jgi:hypothetical protein
MQKNQRVADMAVDILTHQAGARAKNEPENRSMRRLMPFLRPRPAGS